MPPKNSRRSAKKLSEFRKLQLELNPSRAREIEEQQRKQCEQCYYKEWELEKELKVNSDFSLIKGSGIIFNLLPAFYLILQRNFENRELVSF